MYTTCKHVGTDKDGQTVEYFAAAFSSLTAAIGGFKVTGNLGADGYGHFESFNASGPRGVNGYFKRVHDAAGYWWGSRAGAPRRGSNSERANLACCSDAFGSRLGTDPSVNHLIMTRAALKEAKYGVTTDDDLQEVHFLHPQPVVYYVLWAGANGYAYTDAEYRLVLDQVGGSCFKDDATIPPSPPPRAPPPPRDAG